MHLSSQNLRAIHRNFLWLGLFVLVVGFSSCKESAQPWESFGDILQENRELSSFNRIRVRGKLLLYITQDTSKKLSANITWGEHLLKGFVTEVSEQGELLIEDRNQVRWLRRLDTQAVCTLNVHDLNKFIIEDNVQVIGLDTLHCPILEVQSVSTHPQQLKVDCGQLFGFIRGTGGVTFEGNGVIFSWSCEKGGFVDARNLVSDDVYIWNFTQRDIWVNPQKQFQAHCYGSGNIYYFKEPNIRFEKTEQGIGRILKLP